MIKENGIFTAPPLKKACKPTLVCKNLRKSYKGGNVVLKDFNCSFESGRIIGLLGPNGCGKSTFMKLVCGLLVPDFGSIYVCGLPRSERTNSMISYLPERTYFDESMQVGALINYFADFYRDFDAAAAQRMLSELSISPSAKLRTLSKGTKEKVQLIMTMSRHARLYLLDEPIAGVDPAARDYILGTIINNYNPEATVVITTHLIHDIEPALDEFCFMGYGGEILLSGSADEIREREGKTLDEMFREVYR